MTVCFFGNYISDYPRIQVLKKGLEKNDVSVIECHTRERGMKKYRALFSQHQQVRGSYDALLVCMGGQTLVRFARMLTGKPVVFDAFASLYVTNVYDRQTCLPNSLAARRYARLDRTSCEAADAVLLDTQAQIDYFIERYGIPRDKIHRVLIGADDTVYKPDYDLDVLAGIADADTARFVVEWHGYIVPFHGAEVVVRAARELLDYPDIEFSLTTRFNGKYEALREVTNRIGATNVSFYPESSAEDIALRLNTADVALGVFGDNQKSRVVIPNKVYEAAACAKPVITARFPVIEEIFRDGESIMLTEPENPRDLAEKILSLRHDLKSRGRIAKKGYEVYRAVATPEVIGKQLKEICEVVGE